MIKLANKIILIFVLIATVQVAFVFAEEKHDDHADHAKEEKEMHDDSEEQGHDDHKGEDEAESEANAQVGPEKGILEADKEKGFKLSPEAEANFQVKKIKVSSSATVELPTSAISTSTTEVNVYRFRAGFYKRIDFIQISKGQGRIIIKSQDIRQGDEIAISGLGFLRVSEIAAFDGAPEGHSH